MAAAAISSIRSLCAFLCTKAIATASTLTVGTARAGIVAGLHFDAASAGGASMGGTAGAMHRISAGSAAAIMGIELAVRPAPTQKTPAVSKARRPQSEAKAPAPTTNAQTAPRDQ